MKEIKLPREIQKDPVLARKLQKLAENSDKEDYRFLMYPDQEAVKASEMVDEYIKSIDENALEIPGVDGDALTYFVNLGGPNDDPKMICGREACEKLQSLVTEMTGVSANRINKANEFWAEQDWQSKTM